MLMKLIFWVISSKHRVRAYKLHFRQKTKMVHSFTTRIDWGSIFEGTNNGFHSTEHDAFQRFVSFL